MLFDSLRYKTLNVDELNDLMTKLPELFVFAVNQVSDIAAVYCYVLLNILVLQNKLLFFSSFMCLCHLLLD